MKQGDIIMVPFPFTDLSSVKMRPALVVSNSSLKGKNLMVCGITSQTSQKNAISITDSHLKRGKLPAQSFVAVDYLSTLKKTLVQYKVGELKADMSKQVIAHLIDLIKST